MTGEMEHDNPATVRHGLLHSLHDAVSHHGDGIIIDPDSGDRFVLRRALLWWYIDRIAAEALRQRLEQVPLRMYMLISISGAYDMIAKTRAVPLMTALDVKKPKLELRALPARLRASRLQRRTGADQVTDEELYDLAQAIERAH